MTRLGIGLVIGITTLVGAGANADQVIFDNPRLGEAPCVVVNDYAVVSAGASLFSGQARIENICPRSVEVKFCFQYLDADNIAGETCFAGTVRTAEVSVVESAPAPVRITGPRYEWRFFD